MSKKGRKGRMMENLNSKGCGLLGLAVIAQAASDLTLGESIDCKTRNNDRLKRDALEFCVDRYDEDNLWWAFTGIEPEWLERQARASWCTQKRKKMGGTWKRNMKKR